MISDPTIRGAMREIMSVAARLARSGTDEGVTAANELMTQHRTIRQALCDHREGYQDALTMGGTVTRCRGCGAPPPPAPPEPVLVAP